MRVAVTGAGGRLGQSLTSNLSSRGFVSELLRWDLPDHNLDDPDSAERLVETYRPDIVIHGAAWTDVDGCARDPELAMRRNGAATGEMAEACARHGAGMIMVSTNEVFDGRRTDGKPYKTTDAPNPGNAYGTAKLAGEAAARSAFEDAAETVPVAETTTATRGRPPLAIVRTAWLFGLPGTDFVQKILAAAERAQSTGQTLSLVSDEIGCPTYAPDLAAAIVDLVQEWADGRSPGGIHHIVNGGLASRADWARAVLVATGANLPTTDVPLSTWPRPSTPPLWGVLEPTPLPGGQLRTWRDALSEYMKLLNGNLEAGE